MKKNKIKNKLILFGLLVSASCLFNSCGSDPEPDGDGAADFESVPVSYAISPGKIDEASGLVASASMKGYLWTHQDSGQPASVYLISSDAKTIKEFNIPGAVNHDWEDIGLGGGPVDGVNYLYIADIGNNNYPQRDISIIYRIPEIQDINSSFDGSKLNTIRFKYPDGVRDAETIWVDPVSKDIFVVSKEAQSSVYRIPYPQSTTDVIVAEKTGVIKAFGMATGGSISPDGTEILIRNYVNTFYWKKGKNETIAQALNRDANKQLTIVLEQQGEGVGFDRDAKGFYTIGERRIDANVNLNYYKKK